MEEDKKISVLDHGYVQCIETWGSDEAIISAARMSTSKSFLGWGYSCKECGFAVGDHDAGCSQELWTKPGDEKLLAYLYNNKH